MVEAFNEAMADAGIDASRSTPPGSGHRHRGAARRQVGGMPLAIALRLPNIPVTRVENYCATGTEAFRGAVYAVASGACDIALALGVEKLKDTGYGGLPQRGRGTLTTCWAERSAPGNFAQLASAYRAKHGVNGRPQARHGHVSVKSHANGAKNPKAHLRKPDHRGDRC
jgi:acetyl-CoA C-acetyltransferase